MNSGRFDTLLRPWSKFKSDTVVVVPRRPKPSSSAASLLRLTDDVLTHTMCCCKSHVLVARASLTCRRFHRLSFNPQIWRGLMIRQFGGALVEQVEVEQVDAAAQLVAGSPALELAATETDPAEPSVSDSEAPCTGSAAHASAGEEWMLAEREQGLDGETHAFSYDWAAVSRQNARQCAASARCLLVCSSAHQSCRGVLTSQGEDARCQLGAAKEERGSRWEAGEAWLNDGMVAGGVPGGSARKRQAPEAAGAGAAVGEAAASDTLGIPEEGAVCGKGGGGGRATKKQRAADGAAPDAEETLKGSALAQETKRLASAARARAARDDAAGAGETGLSNETLAYTREEPPGMMEGGNPKRPHQDQAAGSKRHRPLLRTPPLQGTRPPARPPTPPMHAAAAAGAAGASSSGIHGMMMEERADSISGSLRADCGAQPGCSGGKCGDRVWPSASRLVRDVPGHWDRDVEVLYAFGMPVDRLY